MPGGNAKTRDRSGAARTPHRRPMIGARWPDGPWRRMTTAKARHCGRRLAAIVAIGLACLAVPAQAQQRPGTTRPSALGAINVPGTAPRLQVPAVVIGAPASETALGISLDPDGALPANSYVRIRGLNPHMALTAGHVIAPGAWAVPIAALAELRLVIPAGASGKSDVVIALMAVDGGVISETRTAIVVAGAALGSLGTPPSGSSAQPPPAVAGEPSRTIPPPPVTQSPPEPARPAAPAVAALPPASEPAASPPPAPNRNTPATPAPLPPADRERAEAFLTRGRGLLQSGDIASARLFFRRAADAGLAEGALAMGDTFDPVELDRLRAVGVQPDATEARNWYEKARTLGAGSAADRRLERLGRR
jgi:hypothetical protein